jgi:hypothetical protein
MWKCVADLLGVGACIAGGFLLTHDVAGVAPWALLGGGSLWVMLSCLWDGIAVLTRRLPSERQTDQFIQGVDQLLRQGKQGLQSGYVTFTALDGRTGHYEICLKK